MVEKKYRSIDEVTHNGMSLREILVNHIMWHRSNFTAGQRADLKRADLSCLDLSGEYLGDADLSGANLNGSKLYETNLSSADLTEAVLEMADISHANLVLIRATEANLYFAKLDGARMNSANLSRANLCGASLIDATLKGSHLVGADLSAANLNSADMNRTDLTQTNLSRAELSWVNLTHANLSGTNLSMASFAFTILADCDLSTVIGLETVRHESPSTIGIDTILKSQGKIPEAFLKGAGVPDLWITYVKSLVANPIEFYSCFISHSAKDQEFCDRLYTDLQAKSVRCWYFPEDATWGKSVWGEIDCAVKVYDKLVVVCSEASLQSGPVNREIERALQREDQENREVLFPIRIDNYLFDTWEHSRKADVIAKVVGDFRDWKDHDTYKKNFEKLLKALNRKQP